MAERFPRVLRMTLPDKTMGSHAIFDLIGALPANTGNADSSRAVAGVGAAEDLVTALQAQYWRALEDPQASLAGGWINSSGEHALTGATVSADTETAADKNTETSKSIETLLSGARRLEDFFGALGNLGPTFMGIKPEPEILRLFAPQEYRATLARHPAVMPPGLVRREHHEAGVDSPLVATVEQPAKPASSSTSGRS